MNTNINLRLAIQKSGRLTEKSLALLKECGIKITNGKNKLKTTATNFPLEVLFLRDDDIPAYIEDGVADIGMLGENVMIEKEKEVSICERLGFANCRLSIAIPRDRAYSDLSYFQNAKIATSYPNILRRFLNENKINAEIHEISGSVEIAPGIGLADAVCDIVSTGSTLLSNGLKEVTLVAKSEAVLIRNSRLSGEKLLALEKLLFRIRAVNQAKNNKYILLNAPNDQIETIINILPGMKSPTILPLAKSGWSSLHSVVDEETFWEKIDLLKEKGAEGILVIPIEKMIV